MFIFPRRRARLFTTSTLIAYDDMLEFLLYWDPSGMFNTVWNSAAVSSYPHRPCKASKAQTLNAPMRGKAFCSVRVAQHIIKYPWNPPPPINQPSITYRSHMRFWIRIEWNHPDCRGFHRQLEPATSYLGRLSTGGNREIPIDLSI